MEVNQMIYKDPETGKIYRQIGGQEPMEIDETFAKLWNLDIDSIPVLGQKNDERVICPNCGNLVARSSFCSECGAKLEVNNPDSKEYTICPCCGAEVSHGKFCPECGAPLVEVSKEPEVQSPVPAPEPTIEVYSPLNLKGVAFGEAVVEVNTPGQGETSEESQAVDDSGFTLLGDFCKKTMATIGGDGYDEIVLYENEADGSFQIHTYSKYAYMQKESHHSFKAKEGAYAALLKLVEKLQLDEYEGKTGLGLCGGMYICKYRKEGVLHRVTTDNLGTDGPAIIIQVGNLLGSFKGDEITK